MSVSYPSQLQQQKETTTISASLALTGWLRLFGRFQRPNAGIVIGGCARSGTTLLLSILSSHPKIQAIPYETQTLCPTAYDDDPDPDAPFKWKILDQHLSRMKRRDSATYWCEKTPKNVHFFKRLLADDTENIKLINIVRDGRDVIVSRHPESPHEFWVQPDRWVVDVSHGLACERHRRVLTVRYEDLVTRYADSVSQICDFLGLPLTKGLFDFPASATIQTSNAWSAKVTAVHQRSIGRWRNSAYANRVSLLLRNPMALELLRRYGYSDTSH